MITAIPFRGHFDLKKKQDNQNVGNTLDSGFRKILRLSFTSICVPSIKERTDTTGLSTLKWLSLPVVFKG